MADFFAFLGDDEGDDVRRLALRKQEQATLTRVFEAGASELINDETDVVAFSNEAFEPDESEAWCIEDFELPPHIRAAFEDPVSCPVLAATEAGLPAIRAIAAVSGGRNGPWTAFQAISRNQVLSPSGLSIILDGNTFRRLETPGLQISETIHAVLNRRGLVFRSLHWARRLFDLREYYREATDEDVKKFMRRKDIEVGDPALFLATADRWIRKRIALVMESRVIESVGLPKIQRQAANYGVRVVVKHGRLILPSDKKELKYLLKLLEEEYYSGPLTDTPYIANSKRRAR